GTCSTPSSNARSAIPDRPNWMRPWLGRRRNRLGTPWCGRGKSPQPTPALWWRCHWRGGGTSPAPTWCETLITTCWSRCIERPHRRLVGAADAAPIRDRHGRSVVAHLLAGGTVRCRDRDRCRGVVGGPAAESSRGFDPVRR